MALSPSFYYFVPALVLVLVFLPGAWLRLRSGRKPNRWTYLAWTMMAAMVFYSLTMGVLALLQSA